MGNINNINRRKFLEIFAGCGCGIALGGCATAPITDRKQLKLIPEVTLNKQAAQIYRNVQKKTKLSNDKKQLNEIKSYFMRKPCFNSSVYIQSDGTPRSFKQASNEYAFGSYKFTDVVRAPNLLEIANSPRVLEIVESYLGCVPTLYSMNAWWSFPNNIRGFAPTERFHRDTDDYKSVTLFIYLTNVEEGSGPYQFVNGSHKASLLLEKLAKCCLDGPKRKLKKSSSVGFSGMAGKRGSSPIRDGFKGPRLNLVSSVDHSPSASLFIADR